MAQAVWLLVLVATVGALRDIEFKHCKQENGSPSCKVKAVQINGCLNPSSWVGMYTTKQTAAADKEGNIVEYTVGETKNPCRIDKGSTLNFSISFEPGFSADSLRSQVALPDLSDCWMGYDRLCPFNSPPEHGCEFTKCPLERGRLQRYETTLRVSPDLQSRPINNRVIYQMRWKLWNNKKKKNNCCFNIPVQY